MFGVVGETGVVAVSSALNADGSFRFAVRCADKVVRFEADEANLVVFHFTSKGIK